jgi:hypothetical protein
MERAKRFLLFVWRIYLRIQRIQEENLPPITIVIPAGSVEDLRETIRALLGSRYRQLRVVAFGKVGREPHTKTPSHEEERTVPNLCASVSLDEIPSPFVADSMGHRSEVKFFEADPTLSGHRRFEASCSDPVIPCSAGLNQGRH